MSGLASMFGLVGPAPCCASNAPVTAESKVKKLEGEIKSRFSGIDLNKLELSDAAFIDIHTVQCLGSVMTVDLIKPVLARLASAIELRGVASKFVRTDIQVLKIQLDVLENLRVEAAAERAESEKNKRKKPSEAANNADQDGDLVDVDSPRKE